MIPKLLHFCWFGSNAKSELHRFCFESCRPFFKDWTIKEWTDKEIASIHNIYLEQAYQARKWAFVSDYVRLYALKHYGGVYLDTDVEIKKSFDPFLNLDFFIGMEEYHHVLSVGSAVIGAQKEHPLICEFLSLYDHKPFIRPNGCVDLTPNTQRFTKYLKEKKNIDVTKIKDKPMKLSERDVIYPKDYFSSETSRSFAVHHFCGSWVDTFKEKYLASCPLPNGKWLVFKKYRARSYGQKPVLRTGEKELLSFKLAGRFFKLVLFQKPIESK